MKSLNIVIIAAADLPEGGGETTRLKTMALAVKAAGHNLRIILENTSGNIDENLLQAKGEFGGISFEYILGNVAPLKGLSFFTSKFKAVKALRKRISQLDSQQKVDVVWFNQLAFHTIYPVTLLAKKLGIKTIHSYEDERIKGSGIKRNLIYFNQLLADKYLSKKADALVVISHYLEEKYAAHTENKVPVAIIPTILNVREWRAAEEPENVPPVLLYYGSFYGFDEVELVIDAIKILKEKNSAVKLFLVGYNKRNPGYMQSLVERCKKLGITELVDFKGFTKHAQLKAYINEANILIGLRKDDEWSQTGLSTKLSEYLATGRLVICTEIGDNPKYLTHKKSALMLRPGCSAEELANTILMAVANENMRSEIGEEGFKVALENFDTFAVKEKINALLRKI